MSAPVVYTGLNSATGEHVSGEAHLRQSVRDILTTPVGSRPMRRAYGSRLPELQDAPINASLIAEARAAIAKALADWEPRLSLIRVSVYEASAGQISADVLAAYQGRQINLVGVV